MSSQAPVDPIIGPRNVLDRLCVVTWRVPKVPARYLEAALLPPGTTLSSARESLGADGVCYLATCQRVTWVIEGGPDAPAKLAAFYQRAGTLPAPETFRGFEAFRHLAIVASSLDSLVPGEPQILGQFKRAVVSSIAAENASPALRHLLGLVLRTAKAIRTQTKLFAGKASLLSLAEAPLRAALAAESPCVAVCGTGEMGAKAARFLRRLAPTARILCVGRDQPRAQALAEAIDGEPMPLRAFMANAPPLQALVLAMAPYKPIFQADWLLLQSLKAPLTVVDLGLPRNAKAPEPLPEGLVMHQIDDLATFAASKRRGAAFHDAMDLLEAELAKVKQELGGREDSESLRHLAQRFDQIAQERWGSAQPIVDERARKWYDQTIRALWHEAAQAVKAKGAPR